MCCLACAYAGSQDIVVVHQLIGLMTVEESRLAKLRKQKKEEEEKMSKEPKEKKQRVCGRE